HSQDRERVAGVFVNRLRAGMLLQTDPTVIYGMGERYQGRIRKVDLNTDTPWNTYTRPGLPPTPIALPGKASILAVLHPAEHDYYACSSGGDGSREYTRRLREHNRAVAKYILKRTSGIMTQQGLFLTLEGVDGAGKSTHIPFMKQLLQEHNISVVVTRE